MNQGQTNPPKLQRLSAKPLLLATLAFAPFALEGQSTPVSQPSSPRRPIGANRELSGEEIFRRFASRILFLTCDESADETSLASGVLASADGLIVTNAHVVGECRTMTVMHISGMKRRSYEPVLKYDERSDTAVLKIAEQRLDFFSVLPQPVRIGERVFAIGNPRGLEQSISEGIVSGNREGDGLSWIQHSAPISPGSSGGALISAQGDLLGINSFTKKESQNLNFAVPAATLARALSTARALTGTLKFPPSADAQFSLGLLHYKGEGVPQDYNEAATWFRSAAEQGNAEAQLHLGFLYTEGHGVQQDIFQAAAWISKAADQGNAGAQTAVGAIYQLGQVVPQDYTKAAAWYRKAAEQGDAPGQFLLGSLYHEGHGVPQNNAEAYFWISVASAGQLPDPKTPRRSRGGPQPYRHLLNGARALTARELAQEQERVREWLASHAKAK